MPYTIYTTGIAWRKDHVPENPYAMANPWAMPWQAKYKGKVAILDDYRESISLGLMKNGIFDLNTTDPSQIAAAGKALQDLAHLTNVHIDNNDYTEVPSGQIWIHHAWSGDMAAARSTCRRAFPSTSSATGSPGRQGPGGVTTRSPCSARRPTPCSRTMFLNYMLDLPNVLTNISYNGYMQPLTAVTPQRLVKEKLLPPSLMSTAVLPSFFRRGVMELQLPAVDAEPVEPGLATGQERVGGRRCSSPEPGRGGGSRNSRAGCSGRPWPHRASSGCGAVHRAVLRDPGDRGRAHQPGIRESRRGLEPAALEFGELQQRHGATWSAARRSSARSLSGRSFTWP